MENHTQMKRSPLYDAHVALGARMVPFAGWDMPLQYAGILDEARAVRSDAGLFDVSHMGRLSIEGAGAASFLDRVLSFDATGMRVGRARYGVICNEEGGIIDDCIVYRRDRDRFLLVPNASNKAVVLVWLSRWSPSEREVRVEDITFGVAMIAVQGPRAAEMVADLTSAELSTLRPFAAVEVRTGGVDALVARTGYTGEDGFELMVPRESAVEIWRLLFESGATPCGLGARDVLRLEAGLLLHGNDMDLATNPYEAGLDRFVDPDRGEYIAGEALRRVRDQGPGRVLVGFDMVGRGIARHGHPIMDGPDRIGSVTSGTYSPTLDRNIGLGYVPPGFGTPGTRFEIDVRGRRVEAEVATLPFYSRRKSA
jgi:aminomethyltransferase